MCFDDAGNLYATNFSDQSMSKFDDQGRLLTYPWGGPFDQNPESCVIDAGGNVFTGEVDGAGLVRKFDQDGSPIETYAPAVGDRGVDWIDLAADQCTLFYTSECNAIKRFDV